MRTMGCLLGVRAWNRLARVVFALGMGCTIEAEPVTSSPGDAASERAQQAIALQAAEAKPDHVWPPRVGERYPNLRLRNSRGERVELESLEGRVVLVEPIGMDCPACNAFAGGNRPGLLGFQGVQPQRDLPSIEEMLDRYAGGISLSDDRIVLVHLLLYRPGRDGPPKLETAQRWAKHFGLEASSDVIVLVGEPYLIGPASYNMIPGFQLIDANFVLRFDATGHHPKHDLWRELLPAVSSLLGEIESTI